ncbi:hypothetical protein B5181_15580 [Streptomyces sp. 4F]|nr:hypothetical protein B5181_15580 [Streptomyces sp. 4F]
MDARGEQARWTRARLGTAGPPLDLLTARFDRHVYAPHAHDEYTVGVTVGGLEVIAYRGGHIHSGPGSIVVLEPGEVHTGGPAAPEGYSSRATDDTVPGADRVARAVRDRLADELLAPPSLAALATDLGLSRYQLLRAFRTATGIPPYAWLAQHRVARARGLLDAGLRPAEAAALVGFADQAHLTRWFRRVLGVTPTAYRNSVQDHAR